MVRKMVFCMVLAACTSMAHAQVSIEAANPTPKIEFKDEVKQTNDAQPEFTSEAQLRAERKAIRKERNTVEVNAGLTASLTNFNSKWKSVNGSSNSITGIANVLVTHNFKYKRFTLDNKLTAKLGTTCQDSQWTKSQDEWFVSTAPAFRVSDKWNLGAIISLRSQFANGFNSNRQITSSCFSPAYLSISLGGTYVCQNPKFPIKINLSPISFSTTFVTNPIVKNRFFNDFGFKDSEGNPVTYDQYLANPKIVSDGDKCRSFCYGLSLDDGSSRFEGGSSIQIDFDRTFGKNEVFRYRTTLYAFYGWVKEITQQCSDLSSYYDHLAPTIRWEHTINIKATKYLATQFYLQLYYNEAQISAIQTQIIFGFGLVYTFKNK